MPDGLGDLATQQPQLGPPVWKQTGVRNAVGQLMVRDQFGNWQVAPGQGDVGTGDDGTVQPVPAPAVAAVPQLVPGRQSYAQPAQANGLQASVAPLDGQAAGVPVPPSLVPIYNRESRFNFQAQNPTSTASGAGQDIDSTFREAMHALGYGDRWAHAKDAPPEVQNAANIWLQGRYGNKPWAASEPGRGGADFSALGQAYQQQALRDYDTERQNMQTVRAELDKATPGSDTYRKLIGRALERSDALQQEFMNTMRHPPAQTPVDAMSNFGSLATVIAIFGGLFARRPLTASLNAAGMAMQAHNQGNYEAYQRSYDTWKTQTGLLKDMLSEQNTQISNVLALENLDERQKMDRINVLASTFGQDRLAAAALRGDIQEVYAMSQTAQKLPGELERQQAQIEEFHARAEKERLQSEGVAGSLGPSKLMDIVDKEGNVVRTVEVREYRDRPGFIESATGKPLELKEGETPRQISPSTTGGGRAGAQVLRQEIGGREVLSDLQNAVSLPVGTTIGALGTVQTGPSVMGALQGDLVRKLTDQDSQLMQASMASMTRELSILMSPVYGGNWAAQQIDPLVPKAGDTLATVMFKLARLAQSADNALEAVSKSPILSNEQKKYSTSLRDEIIEAIPWTPAQALEFAHQGGAAKENFGEFVKRGGMSGERKIDKHPDQIQGGWLFKWSSQQNKYVADHQVQ